MQIRRNPGTVAGCNHVDTVFAYAYHSDTGFAYPLDTLSVFSSAHHHHHYHLNLIVFVLEMKESQDPVLS
jgi:hypothetical protein